jgi:hypothetical protein
MVGYEPQWMPLPAAIKHVHRVAGGTPAEAWNTLWLMLREGAIKSRYRGQSRGEIAAEQWYRAAICRDGSVEFGHDPRYPLLRSHSPGLGPLRHQIEVCRTDVLKWWPATDEPPQATGEPPRAIEATSAPSGVRTNKDEAAETACEEWIAGLKERPANKNEAFEGAKAAVKKIGSLSRKAFERAWAGKAKPGWKIAGRRKKSLTLEI